MSLQGRGQSKSLGLWVSGSLAAAAGAEPDAAEPVSGTDC
jgi:hypothetical protein